MERSVDMQAIHLPRTGLGVKSRFPGDFGGFQDLIIFEYVMII
jgi:hypothetical protein